jgi:hypothetical protein
MRKSMTIAIAAAAVLVSSSAWAKKHPVITPLEREDCLMTDNNEDGTEWCVKFGKGMSQAQIDEFYINEGFRAKADVDAILKRAKEEGW